MSEKRDLEKDLAICEAATPPPWKADGKELWHVGKSYDDLNDPHIYIGKVADWCEQCKADLRFLAEAREGWPHAIRRAMEAEAEDKRLRAERRA